MAVHVKPVKKGAAASGVENAVHFYRHEVDARPRTSGSFLGAFVRHSGVPAFFCQARDAAEYDDFVTRVTKADDEGRECRYVPPGDVRAFKEAPILRIAEGPVAPLLWRRRTLGQRRYSVVGEFADLGAAWAHDAITGLLTDPVQHWDAMVFPSKTLKAAAERLIATQSEYLTFRTGGSPSFGGSVAVIPPGINASAYADSTGNAETRTGVRRRLGVRDGDLCVLVTGHFQFYSRAHPTPLFLALEAAARRTGARVHLIQAGWFDNEKIERAYRDAVRDFAPAVNAIFLDGREPDIRDRVWFAADCYAAFDDAIGHGVDTDMLEAMAAGLPIIAADWGSNRDIVRGGKDGYLIPTWLPLPESGGDLTLAPENALGESDGARADTFLAGTVSQATALDVRAAAEAFEAVAGNPGQREQMSANARKRALETYDWPVVIRRHQALWSELRRARKDAPEVAPPAIGRPAVPHLDDPFAVFRGYATHAVDERTTVTLAPGLRAGEGVSERLARLRANAINDVAQHALLDPKEQEHLLERLNEKNGVEVIQLAEMVSEKRRYRLPRTLAWLAKMGIVILTPSKEGSEARPESLGVSLVELGLAARRQGSERQAAEYFRSALAQNPADVVANLQLGEIRADAHDLTGAVEHFERAVAGNPNAVDARLDLGKALVLKGDHQAGIAYLQEAIDLAPENAEAHYLLGAAYRRAGAADEAVKALERSLRLNPKRVETLVHLGYARKSAGRRAEALQSFRDALRVHPGDLFARAGEMSLGAERDGRNLVERDGAARRVALHFNGPQQFQPLADLFTRMQGVHWPLLTADGRELVEFKPDVVVVGGVQTRQVRELLPNALIVAAPVFLASQNRHALAFDGADLACAPSELMAEAWERLGLTQRDRIQVVGHLPLDPLFRGDALPPPTALRDSGATVLYAPGHRPSLSSAALLGEDVVRRIRGGRDDVTVVIKPHPETFRLRPAWIETWRKAVEGRDRAILVDTPEASALPYLVAADALVTDVSSMMFDFLAVDRPILLLRNPEYAADEAGFDAQGIEWRWREIGREVGNPDDLARAVDLALKTPDAGTEVRARYRTALFGETDDGRTAERMVELITELST